MEIPGFEILGKIAEGGMATVLKARQVSLNRLVAIKVLDHRRISAPDEIARFLLEARAAASLKHPNIIQVYDVGEQNGFHYIIMEYVAGDTLARMLASQRPLPQDKAIDIVRQVAEALESAWDKSTIVHRDIKPGNIMIDEDGNVKLADLGLAMTPPPSGAAGDGTVEGTPNYMSPEQARGVVPLSCRTDMYGLGTTLYHMVTGRMPFEGRTATEILDQRIDEPLTNPQEINSSLSPAVTQLIARMTMQSPGDRFKNWTEALMEIHKVASMLKALRSGDSTADAARRAAPAGKRVLKKPASPPPETPRSQMPAWIHIPIMLLLVVWFVWLAHKLGWLPRKGGVPAEPIPAVQTVQPSVPAQPDSAQIPYPNPPASEEPPKVANLAPAVAPPPVTPSPTNDIRKQVGALKKKLAGCLLAEHFSKAMEVVNTDLKAPQLNSSVAGLSDLPALIQDVSAMNRLLQAAFNQRVGREVTLRINGQEQTVILQAVAGDKVSAKAVNKADPGKEENPIVFSISRLDPSERNRWLGDADTTAKQIMKCILSVKAGDWTAAKRFAQESGPLADALLGAVEDKARATPPPS